MQNFKFEVISAENVIRVDFVNGKGENDFYIFDYSTQTYDMLDLIYDFVQHKNYQINFTNDYFELTIYICGECSTITSVYDSYEVQKAISKLKARIGE